MKIKMISSEDKEEWLKETYDYLQKLKEDKYGDIRLDYIMLYELHEEEHKEIERLNNKLNAIRKYLKDNEREYGSLEDNEKIVLEIIEGDDNE